MARKIFKKVRDSSHSSGSKGRKGEYDPDDFFALDLDNMDDETYTPQKNDTGDGLPDLMFGDKNAVFSSNLKEIPINASPMNFDDTPQSAVHESERTPTNQFQRDDLLNFSNFESATFKAQVTHDSFDSASDANSVSEGSVTQTPTPLLPGLKPKEAKPEDPNENEFTRFYDNLYYSETHGKPIVGAFILRNKDSKTEFLLKYPPELNVEKLDKNKQILRAQYATQSYTAKRNTTSELQSCLHLVPGLAFGAQKKTSLVDFVHFILPTNSGNVLFGTSYVLQFTEEPEPTVEQCADGGAGEEKQGENNQTNGVDPHQQQPSDTSGQNKEGAASQSQPNNVQQNNQLKQVETSGEKPAAGNRNNQHQQQQNSSQNNQNQQQQQKDLKEVKGEQGVKGEVNSKNGDVGSSNQAGVTNTNSEGKQDSSGSGEGNGNNKSTDETTQMPSENASKNVKKKEESDNAKRYYVAICLVFKVPFFGLIGSRLEYVAQSYFDSKNFEDHSLLLSFVEHINRNDKVEDWSYESLFFNLEYHFKPFSLCLSYRALLFLLKSLLSEQRIAIYSECAARTSTCILSVLTMIPCANSFNFNSKAFGSLWFNWKKYGFPLDIFRKENPIYPYFTESMLPLLDDTAGYMIGITDLGMIPKFTHQPSLIFDLEDEVIKLKSRELLGFYSPSFYEISFFNDFEIFDELELDDEPLRMVLDTSENIFHFVGDYLSKAPSTLINLGGKASRIYNFGRNLGGKRHKESYLRLFDVYFPGALPKFLRFNKKPTKTKETEEAQGQEAQGQKENENERNKEKEKEREKERDLKAEKKLEKEMRLKKQKEEKEQEKLRKQQEKDEKKRAKKEKERQEKEDRKKNKNKVEHLGGGAGEQPENEDQEDYDMGELEYEGYKSEEDNDFENELDMYGNRQNNKGENEDDDPDGIHTKSFFLESSGEQPATGNRHNQQQRRLNGELSDEEEEENENQDKNFHDLKLDDGDDGFSYEDDEEDQNMGSENRLNGEDLNRKNKNENKNKKSKSKSKKMTGGSGEYDGEMDGFRDERENGLEDSEGEGDENRKGERDEDEEEGEELDEDTQNNRKGGLDMNRKQEENEHGNEENDENELDVDGENDTNRDNKGKEKEKRDGTRAEGGGQGGQEYEDDDENEREVRVREVKIKPTKNKKEDRNKKDNLLEPLDNLRAQWDKLINQDLVDENEYEEDDDDFELECPAFTFKVMFEKMRRKSYYYRYLGYINTIPSEFTKDHTKEIEYSIFTRIQPLRDFLLKFMKSTAYVGGKGRRAFHLVMDFSFDLDSMVDFNNPVDGIYVVRKGRCLRGSMREVPESEAEEIQKLDDFQKKNYLLDGDEEVTMKVPSILATYVLEIQNNHSIDFVELWVQTHNFKEFYRNHNLEVFNEPVFYLTHNLAKYTYPNGDFYVGELVDMLRDGRGSYVSKDGSRYDGSWKRDKRYGKGTLITNNMKYTGEWVNDKKHGFGRLETPNCSYVGDFRHNRYHGNGTMVHKDGIKLKGEFRYGRFEGKGMMTLPDGSVRMGTFKNGIITGICSVIDKNGKVFVGQLYGDLFHGKGVLKYNKHTCFEGYWAKGRRCRQGTITTVVSGSVMKVEGVWEDDNMLMNDVLVTFPNGYKYNGSLRYFSRFLDMEQLEHDREFRKLEPAITDKDVRHFVDEFNKLTNKLLPHGNGICKDPHGGVYNGTFFYGSKHGKTSQVFPNGLIYTGPYYLGRLHGKGRLQVRSDGLVPVEFTKGKLETPMFRQDLEDLQNALSHGYTVFEEEFSKYKLDSLIYIMKSSDTLDDSSVQGFDNPLLQL